MATQGARAAAAAVHLFTATGAVLALLMVHFSYHGQVETVLWLFLVAMVIDGDRRDAGPPVQGQGGAPGLRRRAPGQHRRLHDLRARTDGPAVGQRVPAGRRRRRRRRVHSPARVDLSVLPDRREDRRPLLPRLPVVLEHRRLLRRRVGDVDRRDDRAAAPALGARVRAHQVPLSVAHREALVRQHDAGDPLARAVGRDHRKPPRRAGCALVAAVARVRRVLRRRSASG